MTIFEEARTFRDSLFRGGLLNKYLWGGARPDRTVTLDVLERELEGIIAAAPEDESL
jgi:hypothetical protein